MSFTPTSTNHPGCQLNGLTAHQSKSTNQSSGTFLNANAQVHPSASPPSGELQGGGPPHVKTVPPKVRRKRKRAGRR